MFIIDVLFSFLFVDIDECASSPCKNGGTCIDLNAEWTSSSSGSTVGFACQCMAGYTGDECDTSKNSCFVVFVRFLSVVYLEQMLTNVRLRLVRTAEIAAMELTSTLVIA